MRSGCLQSETWLREVQELRITSHAPLFTVHIVFPTRKHILPRGKCSERKMGEVVFH